MDHATLLLAILPALCLVAGVFVGAWITHRAYLHASPVPNPGALVRSVINVVRSRGSVPPKPSKAPPPARA